jgi:uncharacterized repeat protein (TIGR03803 family)
MRATALLLCVFLFISAVAAGAAIFKTLHSFTNGYDDQNPFPGVILDQAGNLYGVTAWGQESEGTIFQLTPAQAEWQINILHEFSLTDPEGAGPLGGLAMDEAGNLYGTASYNHVNSGCGTIFKMSRSEGFSVLHYFNGPDGCDPEATLTYSNGWLWGTTRGGGAAWQGTVFSLQTSGDSFQFHSFWRLHGTQPLSAFTLWGYGTTFSGGAAGKGNIYRLDPVKGLINKHYFTEDRQAGYGPKGDLLTMVVGGVRTIYGTNSAGGVGGGGTVYRLTEIEPNSERWRISVLHSFSSSSGNAQGWAPMAGLTADAAGNLYGTTGHGGDTGWDCGTVFKLSPGQNNRWTYTVLHSFDGYKSEGCLPTGSLVFDQAGNLYGTTQWGGESGSGTVFEITP